MQKPKRWDPAVEPDPPEDLVKRLTELFEDSPLNDEPFTAAENAAFERNMAHIEADTADDTEESIIERVTASDRARNRKPN